MARWQPTNRRHRENGSAELVVFGLLGALIMVLALPLVSSVDTARATSNTLSSAASLSK